MTDIQLLSMVITIITAVNAVCAWIVTAMFLRLSARVAALERLRAGRDIVSDIARDVAANGKIAQAISARYAILQRRTL